MGPIEVPDHAFWGAQTQRAIGNFQFSSFRFPKPFLTALALIKRAAAEVNRTDGSLDARRADAIVVAAQKIADGKHDDQFPLDIFQTGSGTSTNMNMNEVIATTASRALNDKVHPNDHVNFGQSSNDVIPTAIQVSATCEVHRCLLPAIDHLATVIADKAQLVNHVIKTGRTHLMDAVPVRMSQELHGWELQVREAGDRCQALLPRLTALAIGGTAVGTGLNAPAGFGERVAERLSDLTGLHFGTAHSRFARLGSQDAALELSAALRSLAMVLTKIANDLRWMNSGPAAGLAEIQLPALQPGSSMMPGKVNPVIPEAVAMIAAQVIGCDAVISTAALSSNFELNVMQPVVAWNLLMAIDLSGRACRALADRAIRGFTVNEDHLRELAGRNPVLVTALAPHIGYEEAAQIAYHAMRTGRSIESLARERTSLSEQQLRELLDVRKMTEPGVR